MATAAELKRRWFEPENAHLRSAVLRWLRGAGRQPSELGEVDGRVDLRGIPLAGSPASFGDQNDPRSGVAWESLDLRRAGLDGTRFFAARIQNCLFDSASATDLRLWGSEVIDCSFRRTDFGTRANGLGTGEWLGRRNIWRRVAFNGADLREANFTACVLDACDFERNGRRIVIEDCEVIDCVFLGDFDSLLVSGHGHRWPVDPREFSADFSRATFTDSCICGYKLDRTRLPEQDDLVVVERYRPALHNAIGWLARNTTIETSEAENVARSVLEMWVKPPGPDDTDLCFDVRGLEPATQDAVLRSLRHAAHQQP